MEIVILFILAFLLLGIILPIAAMGKIAAAQQSLTDLNQRFEQGQQSALAREADLMRRVQDLEAFLASDGGRRDRPVGEPGDRAPVTPQAETATVSPESQTPIAPLPMELSPAAFPVHVARLPGQSPPPFPAFIPEQPPIRPSTCLPPTHDSEPDPAPATAAGSPASATTTFTLEQFMGVKLFAWIGGLALFLGIVFFVKLGIERGWISPELRTAAGFIAGLGLLAGGLRVHALKAYTVLGQTLCATGVVVLYGMTYVAHAYYEFPFFREPVCAFALMSVVTAGAFVLAVRLPAQVVAVLGMLGGFGTPFLCATGTDSPLTLFGYIALLDIGVLAVGGHRRWPHLNALAAGATVLTQMGWWTAHFTPDGYAAGSKTWVAMAVFLGFALLFAGAVRWPRRFAPGGPLAAGAALAVCASAMVAAFGFLGHDGIVDRPLLLYGFVLAVNLVVMAVAWRDPQAGLAPAVAGLATFVHMAAWTTASLTPASLAPGLVIYLAFGLLHTAHAILWQRRRQASSAIDSGWVGVSTLLLLLVPLVHFSATPVTLWAAFLIADLGIVALAFVSLSLLPVVAALVLTQGAVLSWLFKLPAAAAESFSLFLYVLVAFGGGFAFATSALARRARSDPRLADQTRSLARWLPVAAAVMPFVLLVLAMFQLRVANPSPVFAVALLLDLFLLWLSRVLGVTMLSITGLLCTLALELSWHIHHFNPGQPLVPVAWYIGFHGLFTLHPHLFRRQLAETKAPWAAAAMAGAGTFVIVHDLVGRTWPNNLMGLLALAFAVPQLISLAAVRRRPAEERETHLSQLAWFGGMSLFFITLAVPLQFEKQWLTLGWALEGAALCWLFRRVPHPGLRATGAGLLAAAFTRLALNPAVLTYHVRGTTPVLNWQLYAYGLTALALLLASRWLRPPRHQIGSLNLQATLNCLGGVLLFLLLNIEIADAFTPAGHPSIAFEFDGHFARDMTYSIAWGLFAFATLIAGFAARSKHTRYAGLGLLGATLLKLFFHDLATLDTIYLSAALIAVALIALGASFLYQRFLGRSADDTGSPR